MANRNLADEVDALAKGLASLRVANKRTVSRVAALEDRELHALAAETERTCDIEQWRRESLEACRRFDALVAEHQPIKLSAKLFKSFPPSLWQRIRAWWAR